MCFNYNLVFSVVTSFQLIGPDEKFEFIDLSITGGRGLMGVASHLTGAKVIIMEYVGLF